MILTVLWEDSRGGRQKGFGPHELLVACLVDLLAAARVGDPGTRTRCRDMVTSCVQSVPKKGIGQLRKALQRDGAKLADDGPVFAVPDRDRIRELWPADPPANCLTAIGERFRADAPGMYDLVFLVDNMESLVSAACRAMGRTPPARKPRPAARDSVLCKAAWDADPRVRVTLRGAGGCASFGRLVERVARAMHSPAAGSA